MVSRTVKEGMQELRSGHLGLDYSTQLSQRRGSMEEGRSIGICN